MECGVFLPIANNGWIQSINSPQYMPTYDLNRDTTVRAEELGFDFALSMVKFRGYGGETEHWDYAADSFALMSGLAEATSRIRLFATVATLTQHPAMTARMAATISDISDGRFGINIVSGWNKYEYSQMGLWPGDEFYGVRYDYTSEYVDILQKLWANGRLTQHGQYFDLEDCLSQPKPESRIAIVFAGQSAIGMAVAAQYGDYNFITGSLEQLKVLRAQLKEATDKTGRAVKAYSLYGIIAAPTDEEAIALAQSYLDGTDWAAVQGSADAASNDKSGSIAGIVGQRAAERIVLPENGDPAFLQGGAFMVPHVAGSYERVAAYLDKLEAEAGIEGVVMTFPEFRSGVTGFGENVMPLMKSRSQLATV